MTTRRLFTKLFWLDAMERSIKSAAQYGLLTLGAGLLIGTSPAVDAQIVNAFLVNYVTLIGAMLGGAIFSLLTSIASAPIAGSDTASLTVDTKELK